jgi:phage/plasmid primase-like uncharacterized protein
VLIVCEGYATGSIHEATGQSVWHSTKRNLKAVALALRAKYPGFKKSSLQRMTTTRPRATPA